MSARSRESTDGAFYNGGSDGCFQFLEILEKFYHRVNHSPTNIRTIIAVTSIQDEPSALRHLSNANIGMVTNEHDAISQPIASEMVISIIIKYKRIMHSETYAIETYARDF